MNLWAKIRFSTETAKLFPDFNTSSPGCIGIGISDTICLISSENISGIYLVLHVIQTDIVAVGDNGMALRLELPHVVHHSTSEEGCAILQGWLVDDDLGSLRLDALHDALDGTLSEVVGIRLHREAIHTYHTGVLLAGIITIIIGIAIIPRLLQHRIGDVVLSRSIALHDCLYPKIRNNMI